MLVPTDCLLLVLDAHMRRHNGYGPKKGTVPVVAAASFLGPWPWPGSMSTMAEHMGIKGKQKAIDRQERGPKKGLIASAI